MFAKVIIKKRLRIKDVTKVENEKHVVAKPTTIIITVFVRVVFSQNWKSQLEPKCGVPSMFVFALDVGACIPIHIHIYNIIRMCVYNM